MNNFQKLQEEEEVLFKQGTKEQEVRAKLLGAVGFFQFVGKIVDVYVPKVVDCLIVTMGGVISDSMPGTRPQAPSEGGTQKFRAPKPDRPDARGRDEIV